MTDDLPDAIELPSRSIFHRLAPLILVVGVVASAAILIPKLPRERLVELRLETPSTIVGLAVEWFPSSSRAASTIIVSDEEPVHGAMWHFELGSAPASLITRVSLPDGPCSLHVRVERTERTDDIQRSITLGDAEQIVVPVR